MGFVKERLIIQGTNDEAVKDKEAFLLNEWCKTSELFIMENANHVFGAKEPWDEENLPGDLEEATNSIINFIRKNL